jgi:hypothetical protein
MSTESNDDAAWAREHGACFQVGPLIEMRGKEKMQIGFTLDLYAALPEYKAVGAERLEESKRIWARLRTFVDSLTPAKDGAVRVEIEPVRTAAYLRPENEMKPEIGLRARIFHGDEYFKGVTLDERKRLSDVERRLAGMGLRPGHW